jgi:outer membrane lipoprotein-sorting protein
MKLTTIAVIATAALIAVLESGSWMDGAIPADAVVLGNVRKYKTLTWKITIPDKAAITQGMALEPYYVRIVQPGGKVWLLDRHERKVILMNPAKKTAKITFIKYQPPDIYEALSNFKNMSQLSAEQIGQRQIGETLAIGFHVTIGHDQATVWVDPQTQLPIRIVFLGTNEWGQTEPELIWSDIVFDVELDESLFRYDLAGYEVEGVDSGRRRWPNKTAGTAKLSYLACM